MKKNTIKIPKQEWWSHAGTYSANLFVGKTVYTILKPISWYKFQDKDLKTKFLDEVYNKSLAITAQNSAEIYHNKAKLTVITNMWKSALELGNMATQYYNFHSEIIYIYICSV